MRSGPQRVVLKQGTGFRLICLPFAGGSARSFVKLARHTPDDWEVVAVQPPPLSEGGALDLDGLAEFYLGLLAGELHGPGLLFGHSLGAAVAHRMARLRAPDPSEDLHLVLSAPPAPVAPASDLVDLDDAGLFALATRRGFLPEWGVSQDFAMRFLLPNLRADLAVLGKRGWVPEPVAMPVHLLGGSHDIAAPPASLAALDVLAPRSTHLVDGGHLYVTEQPEETARALVRIGREAGAPGPSEADQTVA
ncbi:thioesterase II family protein [Streptomyces sp. NPDC058045]|uniref:thioesterase II family protein n=1 Tax=Streptomyces sp. NPDC058045 TaxID=3346311 RepID=UPI0036E901BB